MRGEEGWQVWNDEEKRTMKGTRSSFKSEAQERAENRRQETPLLKRTKGPQRRSNRGLQ